MSMELRKGYVADEFNAVLKYAIASGSLQEGTQQVDHYQVPGLYVRRCRIPAGTVAASYVHRYDHVAYCLKGTVILVDQDGTKTTIDAPDIVITKAGTQRAIYAVTDVDWATSHATDHTDIDTIEETLGCHTMAEYHALIGHEESNGAN